MYYPCGTGWRSEAVRIQSTLSMPGPESTSKSFQNDVNTMIGCSQTMVDRSTMPSRSITIHIDPPTSTFATYPGSHLRHCAGTDSSMSWYFSLSSCLTYKHNKKVPTQRHTPLFRGPHYVLALMDRGHTRSASVRRSKIESYSNETGHKRQGRDTENIHYPENPRSCSTETYRHSNAYPSTKAKKSRAKASDEKG